MISLLVIKSGLPGNTAFGIRALGTETVDLP
jgi:hypothetical protein